ncbi:MAG: pentapeptide repeat-containing protein [Desulfobaccales bacterium]
MKYNWEGAYCENPPWENDPEGLCILHSLVPEKDKTAFDQALQDKLAREDYDFREVFSPGPISLIGHKFKKPVSFHGTRFSGWADFREAEFVEGADFSHARFAQAALFEKARFAGQILFKETEVAGEADFRNAAFDGLAIFQGINERRESAGRLPLIAYFQDLAFGPWGRLRFQDLSLGLASFLGTDMRRLEFHNVRWYSYQGRQAVYDEILLRGRGGPYVLNLTPFREPGHDYEGLCARVEELYRYLKLNYEEEGDLKQAGDFHFGEMEMHRQASFWRRWFPLSWYNLYLVLSGYGERPLRALGCLVGLVAGMASLLQWLGLQTSDGRMAGFGEAVIYLLELSSLMRPEWPKPITTGGHFLSALSHFLILGQAAMFLLAIRNRLGRRH